MAFPGDSLTTWIIIFLIAIVLTIFWIYMIVDVMKRDFANQKEKNKWLIIVIALYFPGALAYLLTYKLRLFRKRL